MMNDQSHTEREHFFGAAKLVAGITMLSRVLGLVRDMAIVALGANRATDSFWTAFRVPNVFRRLFGEGALTAAFVPVFTETVEKHGWGRARAVLANTAGLLAMLLAAVVAAIEIGLACALVWAPGLWDRQLLIELTMVLLPFMFTVCLLATGAAALNCRGHFAYPAFAPMLLNVFLIAGAWAAYHFTGGQGTGGLFILSVSVVAAGVTQVAGVVWLLARSHLASWPRVRPLSAEVRRIAILTIPMMVPLGLTQISSLFESFYAWFMTATEVHPTFSIFGQTIDKPLQTGVVTCLYAAERLYNFPMGILAVSLATAVFPLFSRYAARGDVAGLREATNRALRLSLFLGVPSGVALVLLARPAVVLIFRHGGFHADDAARAALILQMYCLGMWAYFCRHILLRAFYAQKEVALVVKVSAVLAVANILTVVFVVFTPLRGAGIGLATAATASANSLVLAWLLHRRWGKLGLGNVLSSLARTVLASIVMAAAIMAVTGMLGGSPASKYEAARVTAAAIPAGLLAFLASARLLGCQELVELRGALGKRRNA
jgi:putative peptidoglycan lipid II flippase